MISRDRWEWTVPAAGVLGLAAMVETALRAGSSGSVLPIALLLGLCATVPLAFASRQPIASATAITAATVLTAALYGIPALTGLAAALAVWALVLRRRIGRARIDAAARDASRREVERALLEHSARGERARIASELHDVVAHHISMISVQAESARLTVPGMPAEGAERLTAIGATARTALTEMRRLLGVLREDAEHEPTRRPQPGLAQLLDLVDEARERGGGAVRLIVRGQVAPLDAGVELAAYRVVQEALTNARRHAPGAAVDVELEYGAQALHLRVRDNGPGPSSGAEDGVGRGGHGLLGMRERVASVGSVLRVGRAAADGFLVEASFPVT